MWAASRRSPSDGLYLEQLVFHFDQPVDRDHLRKCWEATVAETVALRTSLREDEDGRLRAFPEASPEIDWIEESGEYSTGWLLEDRATPFGSDRPPWRCRYLVDAGVWLWTFHHALLEGRSILNVLQNFFTRFSNEIPQKSIAWCGHLIPDSMNAEIVRKVWGRLADSPEQDPEPLAWDGDPAAATTVPHRYRATLPASTFAAMHTAATAAGTTVHGIAQWAWAFTVARVFALPKPVIGVVRAAHWAVEGKQPAAGYLMNTLPVPADAAPESTLGVALGKFRDAVLAIRDLPDADLRTAGTALGRPSALPWDAVAMTDTGYLPDQLMAMVPPGLLKSVEFHERTGEPLSASAWLGDQPAIEIEASPRIFSAETTGILARAWLRAIELASTSDLSSPLGTLDPLPLETLGQLRENESGGEALAPAGATLWYAFSDTANDQPDAIALRFAGTETTYLQLLERAESLAAALAAAGVKPGDRVASRIDDRRFAALSVLACARLQAVYMPFDADLPADRVRRMLEIAAPAAMIRDADSDPLAEGIPLVHPETHDPAAALSPFESHDPYAPFCLLFTSGSTGMPKGVINHHHGILNEVLAIGQMLAITPEDRVMQFASLGFDAALEEILATLICGATLVPREDMILESFDSYQKFLSDNGVTIADLPTAYWAAWCSWLDQNNERPPASIRAVIIGGEKAGAASTIAWNRASDSRIPVYNTYGPTETAIVATASRLVIPAEGGDPPIGRPLPGLRARITDALGRSAAPGRPGELWLGGSGVGLGYWENPDRTAESFVQDSAAGRPAWYKTGDLARMDADGVLHFQGRVDDQVKIRGKRIEPGEILSRIESHPSVRQAFVGAKNIKGQTVLVAWVVAAGEDAASLSAYLQKDLPSWMVPSLFVFLDSLPLNARGKVDRKQLPEPAVSAASSGPATNGDPLEVWMGALFAEVLGVDPATILPDLDFAAQGGDSLSAMVLATRLRQAGVDLDPGELAADSSPRLLAEKIDKNYGKARTTWDPILRLRSGDPGKPPLILIHATPGDVLGYANFVTHLPKSTSCFGVVSRCLHLPDQPHTSIEEMASAYIAELDPILQGKRWILAGWCYGGILAYEMARQLVARGDRPPVVIMIEAWVQSPASRLDRLRFNLRRAFALLRLPSAERNAWLKARVEKKAPTENLEPESDGFTRSAVYQANLKAIRKYQPGRYRGDVHVFLTAKQAAHGSLPISDGGWDILGVRCITHEHTGSHELALRPPHVEGLAATVTSIILPEMKA